MNRLFFTVIALSFVFAVAIAQSEEDSTNDSSSEDVDSAVNAVADTADTAFDMATDNADTANAAVETAVNTAVDAGGKIEEEAEAREEQLNEAISDMMTYFTKSNADMVKISETIQNISEDNTEATRNSFVDSMMSYAEDTEMLREQIHKLMGMRAQFQASILKQMHALPISKEDAEKLESDLREQIKLRANTIPSMQNMMDYPQQVSKFIPRPIKFILH